MASSPLCFTFGMQRPTLENVRIRSTRDALHVFYGVACGVLPLITRRLDVDERRSIAAGHAYVWEERSPTSESQTIGMERWTDGMAWGPSRVRDGFLFYHQKELEDDPSHPVLPWTMLMRKREALTEGERLVKQTYSVHVVLPSDHSSELVRKWHLTAYFSQETLESLRTVDTIPNVGDVPVPEGMFKSARAKSRRDGGERSNGSSRRPSVGLNSQPDPPLQGSVPAAPRRTQYPASQPSWNSYPPTSGNREQSWSPPSSTTSSPCLSPAVAHSTLPRGGGLVPLEVLQNTSTLCRDPADEELLNRLSTNTNTGFGFRPSQSYRR